MIQGVTALPPDTVHVWQGTLALDEAGVADALLLLSPAERHRAAGYRSCTAGMQFVVGRAWLRRLLGSYTGVTATALSIMAPRHEKPVLVDPPDGLDIRFNVSHAGGRIVCAVAAGFEVGIDIEEARPGAVDALAGTILSASEAAHLEDVPAGIRNEAVLRHWTRKEAVLKGLGTGLRLPPAHLELGLDAAAMVAGAVTTAGGIRWTVWDLDLGGTGFGAVVGARTPLAMETFSTPAT